MAAVKEEKDGRQKMNKSATRHGESCSLAEINVGGTLDPPQFYLGK